MIVSIRKGSHSESPFKVSKYSLTKSEVHLDGLNIAI